MEYLSFSVEEYLAIKDDARGRLSLPQVFSQMLDAVRELHELGFIHRDIKPEAFRINEWLEVKIMDVAHIKKTSSDKPTKPFFGEPLCASLNAHLMLPLGRRDDLESLGYAFLYIINSSLIPWSDTLDQNYII